MAVTNSGKSPVKCSALNDALTGRWRLTYLRWVGATTAGHVLVVNDEAGDLIWSAEADGPNFNDIQPIFENKDGLVVATMQSGYLLVYYQ